MPWTCHHVANLERGGSEGDNISIHSHTGAIVFFWPLDGRTKNPSFRALKFPPVLLPKICNRFLGNRIDQTALWSFRQRYPMDDGAFQLLRLNRRWISLDHHWYVHEVIFGNSYHMYKSTCILPFWGICFFSNHLTDIRWFVGWLVFFFPDEYYCKTWLTWTVSITWLEPFASPTLQM